MAIEKVGDDLYRESRTGTILSSLDGKNLFRHRAILFHDSEKDVSVLVGGRSLYEMRVLSDARSIADLARACATFAYQFTATDRSQGFSNPAARDGFVESLVFDGVYGCLFMGDDIVLATTKSNVFGFAHLRVPEKRTIAQTIDQFYSGVPKQTEQKVVQTINKAKRQVVAYLKAKGINPSANMAHGITLRHTNGRWYFGWDNVARTSSFEAQSFYVVKASCGIGQNAISRIGPRVTGLERTSDQLMSLSEVDTLIRNTKYDSIVATSNRIDGLGINSLFGRPLHEYMGGVLGKYIGRDGSFSMPGEDLSEEFFHKHFSYMKNQVLDGDVIAQQPNEPVADYERRLQASADIISKRLTNIVATPTQWYSFSHAVLAELCDRALIGGPLFANHADTLMGATSWAPIGTTFHDNQMGHTFEKSY